MREPVVAALGAFLAAGLAGLGGLGCTGAHIGGPCGAHNKCGDGEVCDLTNPGGPLCLDGSGDEDGDGIPNDHDFCDHMPGGAYDEDGDGIGDECDACPVAAPPETPDPDGDGVDSPCDPDPTTPGDKIVLFNGFNAPLPMGWTASAAWQVQGGEAIVTPVDPTAIEQISVPLPLLTTHTVVLAGYRIDRVDPAATEHDAGVVTIDRRPAGVATISCGGARIGTQDLLKLETDTATGSKSFTNLFDTASLYRVAEQLDGATAACAMIADRESGAVQAGTGGNAPSEAGLIARGTTARFAYVLVIQRP